MKAVMGSFSGATSACILASRIIKLVAQVSSSTKKVVAPASMASTILAACDVDPDASPVLKQVVSCPKGRLLINGDTSVRWMYRPSSARIFTAAGSQDTSSRPSPLTLSYTPTWSACSKVDLPWNPPPMIKEMPFLIPIPRTVPAWGRSMDTSMVAGDANKTKFGSSALVIGRSSTPLFLGKTDPFPTNAHKPFASNCLRRASWSTTASICAFRAALSRASYRRAECTACFNPSPTISAAR
mmetsp:Transcript_81931/g.187518  ORF Transcript_81931/g.187518 Transcript_81931/m.187518 type:complete len:241 (-) Transcript_81931:562-1284(-)